MPEMNFNAEDPLNPLLALLARHGQFGRAGRFLPFDAQNLGTGSQWDNLMDPRYFEEYTTEGSEGGGGERRFRPNQQTLERLGGRVQIPRLNVGGPGGVRDPSLVDVDEEFGLLTALSNLNEPSSSWLTDNLPYIFAAIGGGAALSHMGAFGAGAGTGVGDAFAGATATGEVTGANPFLGAVGGGEVTGGAVDPFAGITGGGEVTGGPLGGGQVDPFAGATAGGDVTGGGLLETLTNNPLRTARGAGALASLIAGNQTGGGDRSGGGGGGGGDPNDPMSIINAMAAANRVNHTSPFGSRQWSQDADGRWSVTDSLSPEEQRNYESVRGMNAGVTDMAAQRLAQLMAGSGRGRADRPLMFGGRMIGG